MPTELPQPLLLILPFIAAPLSGWLSHDSLPEEANDAIALTVVLALAVVADLLTAPISSDITLNFAMIFVYCVLLMNQPLLASLQRWFTLHVGSPFVPSQHSIFEDSITTTNPPPQPTIRRASLMSTDAAMPPSRVPRYPLDDTLKPMPPVQQSRPLVSFTVPSQQSIVMPEPPTHDTAPMVTPETPTPVEESPTQH